LDSLDITALGTPNSVNLGEGDLALVSTISGATVEIYFYVFDASATDAESSPDQIRPDDYSSAGVWRLVEFPNAIDSASELATYAGLGSYAQNYLDDDSAAEVRTTLDAQQDLDTPSQAQAEDNTNTNEYVWSPQLIWYVPAEFLEDNYGWSNALTAEPTNEWIGMVVLVDNDNWDPANVSGTTPYYAICTATGTPGTWKAMYDAAGNRFSAATHVETLEEDELNDDTGDRLLTSNELKSHYISNSGAGAAMHFDFPAQAEGWDFCFIKEADYNIVLDPNGTEQWYFRNSNAAYSQLAAGENIENTTSGVSVICGFSTEGAVYFTGDVNWDEETP
jgi:hypothetical protein